MWCVCVRAGDHLCQVSAEVYSSGTAAGGAKLPSHLHPPRHAPGGEVSHGGGGEGVLVTLSS